MNWPQKLDLKPILRRSVFYVKIQYKIKIEVVKEYLNNDGIYIVSR